MNIFITTWVIIINFAGFTAMGVDKRRARKRKYRIPESTLWLLSILGGAFGTWLGIRFFRHKTQHLQFKYGIPLLMVIWIAFILTLI